jgi:hypothetical protein
MSKIEKLCTYCSQPNQAVAQTLLESMEAFACTACKNMASSVSSTPTRIQAPWSVRQVNSLRSYQNSPVFYHYVCNNKHELSVSADALYCEQCSFKQDWAYRWSTEFVDGTGSAPSGAGVPRDPNVPTRETAAEAIPEKKREFA